MLKVFNQIRKDLIKRKKVEQYLLYALGEIILVVIGILIALWINNLNEERIIRERETRYLIGLRNEFQSNKHRLMTLLEQNQRNYEGGQEIIALMSKKEMVDETEFSQVLYNTFAGDIAFNANNSLLIEMINSGSLKDVSNINLRKQLTTWMASLDDIRRQEEDLKLQREKVLDFMRTENYSLRTVLDQTGVSGSVLQMQKQESNASNLALLESTSFENNVLMFMLTTLATGQNHYEPLLLDINTILDLINNVLDNI